MTILSSIHDGLQRATATPQLILFLWLFNFAVALPLALVMSEQIESSLGASLRHEQLRRGFDMDWFEEFSHNATGLGKTLSPAVIGVGPFLGNVESWLDGSLFAGNTGVIGLGIGYMIAWMFLLGGIFERWAHHDERLTMERFFSASGRYFLRFILLFLLAAVFYFLVFTVMAPALFSFIANSTRDATVERNVFFLIAGAYALIALMLAAVNMVFDYAKISTVLNGQRNVLVAALEGARFIFTHPAKTFGLYFALGIFLLLALVVYSFIAPGAGQASGFTILLAFLAGQILLVVKLVTRLTFFAGQMALYQNTRSVKLQFDAAESLAAN